MYTYCCLCILRAATLTEVFPCFFLGCKANASITSQDGARPALFQNCCVVLLYCLFRIVLCIVCEEMCTVLQPPGDNPIAVNKYISYQKSGKTAWSSTRILHIVWGAGLEPGYNKHSELDLRSRGTAEGSSSWDALHTILCTARCDKLISCTHLLRQREVRGV